MYETNPDGTPAWSANPEGAPQMADLASSRFIETTVMECGGPFQCSMDDHGEAWVRHIARIAAQAEAHGAGNGAIRNIDDCYQAMNHNEQLREADAQEERVSA